MKKTLITLFLCLCAPSIQAQEDTLQTAPKVMRATLYGIGHTNLLDTYLSPMEYTGPELRIVRENLRTTRHLDGKVFRQSLFQANVSLAQNRAGTGSEFSFLANWSLAYHYKFLAGEKLQLLAGPHLDLNGGMIYNMRNSNNPVNAKAYANLGASGMAVYHFKVKDHPLMLRYQLKVPLLGLMFSPEYGQPYYEMSLSKDFGKNICFTSLHNQPSVRQMLTLDVPVRKATLRIGYACDIQQAKVNHLKSHAWSHSFLIGFVKHFQSVGQSINFFK